MQRMSVRVAQALLTEPSDNDEIWSRHDIHELAHAFGLHLELVCVCVCVLCVYCPQLLRPHCRLGTITHTHVCVLLLRCHALHVSSSSYKLCAAASAQSHTHTHTHTHTLSLSLSLTMQEEPARRPKSTSIRLHTTSATPNRSSTSNTNRSSTSNTNSPGDESSENGVEKSPPLAPMVVRTSPPGLQRSAPGARGGQGGHRCGP